MGLALAGLLLLGTSLAAPMVRPASDEVTSQITMGTGFENALLPLSLAAAVTLPVRTRPLTSWVELKVPLLRFDLGDHALTLGARVPLLDQAWDVEAGLGLREVSTRNDAYAGTAVGSVVMMRAGHFQERWTLASEAELWNGWATHIRTTPYAIEVAGAEAFSGWTGWTTWSLRAGVVAAGRVGPVELGIQLGYESRGKWNLVIPPLYGRANAGVRF